MVDLVTAEKEKVELSYTKQIEKKVSFLHVCCSDRIVYSLWKSKN